MANGRLSRKREAGAPPPGSDLSELTQLDLIDVTLLTEFHGQPTEVPRLCLGFDGAGMTVKRPDGASYVTIPWTAIKALSADIGDPSSQYVSTAVELEIETDRKHHRFVVPNVQAGALTDSIRAMSARGGGELVTAQPPKHGRLRRSS